MCDHSHSKQEVSFVRLVSVATTSLTKFSLIMHVQAENKCRIVRLVMWAGSRGGKGTIGQIGDVLTYLGFVLTVVF